MVQVDICTMSVNNKTKHWLEALGASLCIKELPKMSSDTTKLNMFGLDMVASHLSRLLREGNAALQPSTVHVCMSFR